MEFNRERYDEAMAAVDADIEAGDLEGALRRLEELVRELTRPEDEPLPL